MTIHSQVKVNIRTAHSAVQGNFGQLDALMYKSGLDMIEEVAKHTLVPAARKSIKTKLKKKQKTHMYKDGVPWESPGYRSKPGKPPIVHVLGKSLRSIIDTKPVQNNTLQRFGYINPHGNQDLLNLACLLENGGEELESQWLANAYANPKFQKHVKQYQSRKAGVKRKYSKRKEPLVKKGTKKKKAPKPIKDTTPWRKDKRYKIGEHWRQRRMSQKLLAEYDRAKKTKAKNRTERQKKLLKEYRPNNPKKPYSPYSKPKHRVKGNESWLLRKRMMDEAAGKRRMQGESKEAFKERRKAIKAAQNRPLTREEQNRKWDQEMRDSMFRGSIKYSLKLRRQQQEATERLKHQFAQLAGKKHQHLRERKRFQHYVKNYGIEKRSQMKCVPKAPKRKRYRNRKWNK